MWEYVKVVCEYGETQGTHYKMGVREYCKRMLGMILGRNVGDLVLLSFVKMRLREDLEII